MFSAVGTSWRVLRRNCQILFREARERTQGDQLGIYYCRGKRRQKLGLGYWLWRWKLEKVEFMGLADGVHEEGVKRENNNEELKCKFLS